MSPRYQIKLMVDHHFWPLWRVGELGNLDPATLPLRPGSVTHS